MLHLIGLAATDASAFGDTLPIVISIAATLLVITIFD